MARGKALHVKMGFVLYGELYPTKNAAIRLLNISKEQLNRLIEDEKQGLPMTIRRNQKQETTSKRNYFAAKLSEHGFWQKEGD
jgi:parvulin-like peptidyl-prolyl isomerase